MFDEERKVLTGMFSLVAITWVSLMLWYGIYLLLKWMVS